RQPPGKPAGRKATDLRIAGLYGRRATEQGRLALCNHHGGPRPMRLIVKLFTVVALATFAAGFVTAPSAGADAATEASRFVSLLNQLRASKGLAPLAVDPALTAMAANWSDHMAAAGGISHNPNLANLAPSNWQTLGENVGMGPTVQSIH